MSQDTLAATTPDLDGPAVPAVPLTGWDVEFGPEGLRLVALDIRNVVDPGPGWATYQFELKTGKCWVTASVSKRYQLDVLRFESQTASRAFAGRIYTLKGEAAAVALAQEEASKILVAREQELAALTKAFAQPVQVLQKDKEVQSAKRPRP